MGARFPPARAPKSSAAPSNSTVAPSWDTLAVMPWMASGSTTVRVVSALEIHGAIQGEGIDAAAQVGGHGGGEGAAAGLHEAGAQIQRLLAQGSFLGGAAGEEHRQQQWQESFSSTISITSAHSKSRGKRLQEISRRQSVLPQPVRRQIPRNGPWSQAPAAAANRGGTPCPSSAVRMPASTSPLPPVAMPALPVRLTNTRLPSVTMVSCPLAEHHRAGLLRQCHGACQAVGGRVWIEPAKLPLVGREDHGTGRPAQYIYMPPATAFMPSASSTRGQRHASMIFGMS